MTQSRGIRIKKFSRLNPTDLEAYRRDPKLEEKRGITSYVVCRECGARRRYLDKAHFAEHGLAKDSYREKWGDPLLYAPDWRKDANELARHPKRRAKHREIANRWSRGHRELIAQRRKAKREANVAEARKTERRYRRKRRLIKGEAIRTVERAWYAKKRLPRATGAELEAFLKDPSRLKYVVCLEPDARQPGQMCGAKLRDIGCAHLAKIHGIGPEEYGDKHSGAPTKIAEQVRRKPGRHADERTAAIVEELRSQGLRWDEIKRRVDRQTGTYRSIDAYQMLLKRHTQHRKPTK